MINKATIARIVLTVMVGICPLAQAADSTDTKNWEFNLAPFYLWAVTLDGDVTLKGQTNSVKLDFGDIFDNLGAAFIVHFEGAYQNRWGFIFDVNYLYLGATQSTKLTEIKVNMEDTIAELDGFYRIQRGRHSFDAILGARYNKIDVKANFKRLNREPRGDESWVDPVFGGRYLWKMGDMWTMILRGDIGGFGMGSDFAWQAVGMVEFKPWKHVSFIGGYRALDMDYESDSGLEAFKFDMLMHGPVLGINFSW